MKKLYDTDAIKAFVHIEHLRHTQKVLAVVLTGLADLERQGVLELVDLFIDPYTVKLGNTLYDSGFEPTTEEKQACMNELVRRFDIRQAGPVKYGN